MFAETTEPASTRPASGGQRQFGGLHALAWSLCLLATGAAIFAFLALIYPLSKSYPFTDEWVYVLNIGERPWRTLLWLFESHNDHRIPLQKAIHVALLRASGFDFRSLLAFNVVLVGVTAWALLDLARQFRGSSHIGDLIIPLIVMNMGFSPFGWGFAAQFASSVCCGALFLALFGRAVAANSSALLIAAFAALTACALTGMNGAIFSAALSVMFLAWFIWRPNEPLLRILPAITLLVSVVVLLTWRPSGASVSPFQIPFGILADWAYQLAKSSFVIRAFEGGWWRATIVVVLAAAAVSTAAMHTRWRGNFHLDVVVYAALIAYLALGAAIIAGRAGHSAWSPGHEMHYGVLVAPIPILSWIIVSKYANRYLGAVIALGLVLIYADAFISNYNWRATYVRTNAGRFSEVASTLRSSEPAQKVADTYISEFYYVDNPDVRAIVTTGIEKLRLIPNGIYSRPR